MVWGSRLLYFKALFLSSVFSEWKLVFTLPTPPPPSHTLISRKILYIKKIFLGKWRKGIGSWAANFQMVLESSDFLPRCLVVGVTSPTTPPLHTYPRVSPTQGYKRQSAATQSVEKLPCTLLNDQPRCLSCVSDETVPAEVGWETGTSPQFPCRISLWLASDYSHVYYLKGPYKKTWLQGKIK